MLLLIIIFFFFLMSLGSRSFCGVFSVSSKWVSLSWLPPLWCLLVSSLCPRQTSRRHRSNRLAGWSAQKEWCGSFHCIFGLGLKMKLCAKCVKWDWSLIYCLERLLGSKDGRWAFQACDDILSPLPHFKVGLRLQVGQLLLNLAQTPHGCKTSFVPGAFSGTKSFKWDKLGYKVKVVVDSTSPGWHSAFGHYFSDWMKQCSTFQLTSTHSSHLIRFHCARRSNQPQCGPWSRTHSTFCCCVSCSVNHHRTL